MDRDLDELDLIELVVSLEEEFSIELPGDSPPRLEGRDWLSGAPVPRKGPLPTLPGGAEAEPPRADTPENGSGMG